MNRASDARGSAEALSNRVRGWVRTLPLGRAAVGLGLYEAAYYIAFSAGMSFSQHTASPFWFPDSILLCALLLSPARWWWLFVFGAAPVRMVVSVHFQVPVWFLLDTFVIDSAKGVVAALLLRRFLPDPLYLRTVRDFLFYCLIAVLLVPALAASAGAGARVVLGGDYWASWQQWFLGNMLAHLVVTPGILYGLAGLARILVDRRPVPRWIEGVFVAVGLIVTCYAAFRTPGGSSGFVEPRFYMPVPFLFWAALRFGMVGASASSVIISVIAVDAALHSHGPFTGRSPADTAFALQQFLLLRAVPVYLVAMLVEQKRETEMALIGSERRYREVVESQTDLVCRFLPGGTLSFVNGAFCRTFQREREALLGAEFVELFPEAAHELVRGQLQRAGRLEERGEWECEVTRPDESISWLRWSCHRIIGPDGEITEFQAIGRDITDRRRAEEANRNLVHASRLAVVGELTAMVAHEINQPLGAILSNAEAAEMLLARENPPLEEIREILSDIRKSDLRASETILRMRALLRKREIHLRPIDLNATVRDALRLVEPELRRRQVLAQNELEPSLPPVSGDEFHLAHVLLNLLVNAMEAMHDCPVAGRVLRVSTRSAGDDMVEVAVIDRGQGIAPDKLPRIFDSFYTSKPSGLGLGLSIARSIVESHGGRIRAENRPEGGATFRFTLRVDHAPKIAGR